MHFFEATTHYFDQAASLMNLTQRMRTIIINTKREFRVKVAIEMDSGQPHTFVGYWFQHNNFRGPFYGGLCYHPNIDEDEARSLASLMTWRTAAVDIPFGGGIRGINCDPDKLSRNELERITRRLVQQIHDLIGPDSDVLTTDIGTDGQVISWFLTEYHRYHSVEPSWIMGRPVEFRGSAGGESAAGYGVAIITREFLRRTWDRPVEGVTFAVQGFGNVGRFTAHFLHAAGAKIVAVSDANGAIFDTEGIDIPALEKHVGVSRKVVGFRRWEVGTNEQLLTMPVDVLISAAGGGVFNATLAEAVRAKVVIEAANSPTWPEADEVFRARGIPVVPDILANTGRVVVDYYEWIQNLQRSRWSIDEVRQKEEERLLDSFATVYDLARRKGVSLRTAAFMLAIRRVVHAHIQHGCEIY
jgi:glutamate dehydrogenase (NAD(P)+)